MGEVGAADNSNMLRGAEGQAACTALAQALAACSSLQTLNLKSEWGKGRVGEQRGGDEGCLGGDEGCSCLCLPTSASASHVCVWHCACVYMCVSGWMCVYVACVSHAIFLYVYQHLYSYVHACLVSCMQHQDVKLST